MRLFIFLIPIMFSIACSKRNPSLQRTPQQMMTVGDISFHDTPPRYTSKIKKREEWIGLLHYSEKDQDDKLSLYNITNKEHRIYPPAGVKLPALYGLWDFCMQDDKIMLMGGQTEAIVIDYEAKVIEKFSIAHGGPQYWADRLYFDAWDNYMLINLALPPMSNFPGLFSLVKDRKLVYFLGKIPSYLQERDVFRDYSKLVADREYDKFYIKYQFDTLVYEYDLPRQQERIIRIPAPEHFQSEMIVNKITSIDDAAAIAARKAGKNAYFTWLKVAAESISYVYLHYDQNNQKRYTLYRFLPKSNRLEFQDITDILKGEVYFSEDHIFSITPDGKIMHYDISD